MKGLSCPCPALPQFGQPEPRFMAQGSGTPAQGQGPPLNAQVLRAQYEGLRRLQRTQAHLMVLPIGGNTPTPAESMTSAVWINKERRSSVSLEEGDAEVEGMPEETARGHHQAPGSAWHTHLELHRLVQTSYQETDHQVKPRGQLLESHRRLPPDGDPCLLEDRQMSQQGPQTPEGAQCQCQVGSTQTKAVGCSSKTSIQCLPSIGNSHRSGKAAHYPFPQRKNSQDLPSCPEPGLVWPSLKLSIQPAL